MVLPQQQAADYGRQANSIAAGSSPGRRRQRPLSTHCGHSVAQMIFTRFAARTVAAASSGLPLGAPQGNRPRL